MYEKIKKWYGLKLWTKDQVRTAVVKQHLTIEEYKLITGEDF